MERSSVTNMEGMFLSSFNSNIASWDVSASDMGVFTRLILQQRCLGMDVSRVRDMGLMFNYASSFNSDVSVQREPRHDMGGCSRRFTSTAMSRHGT